ncbi:MAG: hypothetical protein ACK56I_10330, partial [bacterium]
LQHVAALQRMPPRSPGWCVHRREPQRRDSSHVFRGRHQPIWRSHGLHTLITLPPHRHRPENCGRDPVFRTRCVRASAASFRGDRRPRNDAR